MELKLGEGVVSLNMGKRSGGSNFVGKIHIDRNVASFDSLLEDFKSTDSSARRQGFLHTSFFGGVVVSSGTTQFINASMVEYIQTPKGSGYLLLSKVNSWLCRRPWSDIPDG